MDRKVAVGTIEEIDLGLIEDNQLVVMKPRDRFYPSPRINNSPATRAPGEENGRSDESRADR
jgi:hypothetical protein